MAVADDSPFIRKAVERILRDQESITVVGTAASGEELLARLPAWRPDVVTLDLAMPGMGGMATLDQIMASRPLPVIILSDFSRAGAAITLEALHRGAVDFIDKRQYSLVDFSSLGVVLAEKVRQVAGSRVTVPAADAAPPSTAAVAEAPEPERAIRAVLIGASTGGPVAIERVLTDLGAPVPVPVVVVQHMPSGFTRAFAERLNAHLAMPVREAGDREVLLPGTVYIAPAGRHLRLEESSGRLTARLSDEPAGAAHRPSVDVLFDSACDALGRRAAALVLTGMGSDGARGLARLASAGAWTAVQDRASCVVFGMPRAALAAGAAAEELPLVRLGARLRRVLEAEPTGAGAAEP
ncbi:MAG: chemotaxis-specific protein-glutamate methyltransferase CheB [Thermoanaerobaculia bacterium]|nr:chemotaxis-specific protein-glutamate methyltransferase CheB [Thermoanaerobaculia bacterium]